MLLRSAFLLVVFAMLVWDSPARATPPSPRRGVCQRVRSGLGSVAKGCRKVVNRIRGKKEKITWVRVNYRAVGDWSTASLLMSSANQVVTSTAQFAPHLAGFGSVGLGIYSLRDFVRAKTPERRVEAAHGIAWSLQGMAGLGRIFTDKASCIAPIAKTVGVTGGALQMGIGGYRIVTAIRPALRGKEPGEKKKARSRAILGALDLGAGACWAASSCGVAAPYTLGGFIVLTAARMAYKKRESLAKVAKKLTKPFKRKKGCANVEEPTVIVTAPTRPDVAERALRGPGTAEIRDGQGNKAVLTPATVRTESGEERPALVVTPVEEAPGPSSGP